MDSSSSSDLAGNTHVGTDANLNDLDWNTRWQGVVSHAVDPAGYLPALAPSDSGYLDQGHLSRALWSRAGGMGGVMPVLVLLMPLSNGPGRRR